MPPADLTLVDRASATRYREGGAGDVPAENERQWGRWAIVPRPLRRRSSTPGTGTGLALLGRRFAAPFAIAPTAAHGLWHERAEAATAEAAAAAEVPFVLSQASTLQPEQLGDLPRLQQIYLPEDRDRLRPFLDRVRLLDTLALVLTVDQLPVPRPQQFRLALGGAPAYPPARHVTVRDIDWLVEASGLPVLVKGVLHPDDARAAIDHGATGIVVSNHGGRQLPGSVTPAEVLPAVVAAVGGRVPVHVDSGIRTAEDVFRALCLGASSAWIGRPVLRELESGGVQHLVEWLRALRDDLIGIFTLTGVDTVSDCTRDLLWERR